MPCTARRGGECTRIKYDIGIEQFRKRVRTTKWTENELTLAVRDMHSRVQKKCDEAMLLGVVWQQICDDVMRILTDVITRVQVSGAAAYPTSSVSRKPAPARTHMTSIYLLHVYFLHTNVVLDYTCNYSKTFHCLLLPSWCIAYAPTGFPCIDCCEFLLLCASL